MSSWRQSLGKYIAGDAVAAGEDQTTETSTTELDFPYTYSTPNKTPLEALFAPTINGTILEQMYSRYQLTKRIIDTPVEESLSQGFVLNKLKPGTMEKDEAWIAKAMYLYNNDKTRILRHFKLTRLYGFDFLLFGFADDPTEWYKEVLPGTAIKWVQPIPAKYVTNITTTESIPLEIVSITIAYQNQTITVHPSRFIHCQNPKLTEETKTGESSIAPVYNLLQVQIHADWAIGQQLWRNAGGLLGLFAPKRNIDDTEKATAMSSLINLNARTVVYIPFGWNVKELFRKPGNIAVNRTYRVILEQIAAGSGIPVSMLIGSQRGALAPGEDDKETYIRLLSVLQENTEKPQLREYFRKYQISGELGPGEFTLEFNNIETVSPYDKSLQDLQLNAMNELNKRLKEKPQEYSEDELIKIIQRQKK